MIKLKKMKKKMNKCFQTLGERNSIFDSVQIFSMIYPCILAAPPFRLIKDNSKAAVHVGPTCNCDICSKFEFQRNAIKLKAPKYQTCIYNNCTTGKSDWTCKSCCCFILKSEMPTQEQLISVWLCPKVSELTNFVLL